MKKVLFVNRNLLEEGEVISDFTAITGAPRTAINEGLPGSVIANEEGLKVGLYQRKVIPEGNSGEVVGPVEMSGKFAVEIDGKFVPHYFAAEDLPKFFDSSNQSGVGIEITPAITPIP